MFTSCAYAKIGAMTIQLTLCPYKDAACFYFLHKLSSLSIYIHVQKRAIDILQFRQNIYTVVYMVRHDRFHLLSVLEFRILMVPKNGPKFDTYRLLRSYWIIQPARYELGYFCRSDRSIGPVPCWHSSQSFRVPLFAIRFQVSLERLLLCLVISELVHSDLVLVRPVQEGLANHNLGPVLFSFVA